MRRTHYCGALRREHMGQAAVCCGWVQTRRDMGGVIFLDVKDREGVLQVVCDGRRLPPEDFHRAETLRMQSVVQVEGLIAHRDEETYNPRLATGEVELRAERLTVLSEAHPLPFSLDEDAHVREELRLKYRYLDLRRPALQRALRFRHRVQSAAERFLDGEGFCQVETPMLCKSTPEGARDYLVPSRVHPGTFYALPQSPQIFKQLLMVGGMDKYYQVARCFRDEDLRADRQPEFTQVDMEMSFVDQEDVLTHLEKLFHAVFAEVMGRELDYAFPRLTWQESMDRYGCDKPDLRFGMEFADLTEAAKGHGFPVFDEAEYVVGFAAPGCASYTRKQIDALTEFVKRPQVGAKGLVWIRVEADAVKSSADKFYTPDEVRALADRCGAKAGDMVFILCGRKFRALTQLCALRLEVAQRLGLRDPKKFAPLWVVDFPMFEWDDETQRFYAMHHPFTSPKPEDVQYLRSDPGRVRANAYDFVCNGTELGGGSIRIHDQQLQAQIFECLGFTPEAAEEQFGFLMNAFRYGAPPHGGLAFGFDRLCSLFGGSDSIRDYIAFPKNNAGRDVMLDAPSAVAQAQLDELCLELRNPEA